MEAPSTCGPVTIKPRSAPRLDLSSTRYLEDGELSGIISRLTPGVTQSTLISSAEKTAIQNRLAQVIANTQDKKVISVAFTSSEGDLQRYYLINSNDNGSCSVEHLDFVIDDFDNG